MGMGASRNIYLGAGFDAGSVNIYSSSAFGGRPWREYLDSAVLPVSSDDPLDGSVEWHGLFAIDRHGGAALFSNVPSLTAVRVTYPSGGYATVTPAKHYI